MNISSSYSEEHSIRNDRQRTESSSRSPQRRRQRGSTQKAMLSKALQKANTAVLLDNAANFEGAIDAYQDACELLQQVMLRSNGGDVEKYKLLEIVSTKDAHPSKFFQRIPFLPRSQKLMHSCLSCSEKPIKIASKNCTGCNSSQTPTRKKPYQKDPPVARA